MKTLVLLIVVGLWPLIGYISAKIRWSKNKKRCVEIARLDAIGYLANENVAYVQPTFASADKMTDNVAKKEFFRTLMIAGPLAILTMKLR